MPLSLNEHEVRRQLSSHFENQTPCAVSRGENTELVVFVASLGDDFVVTRRVHMDDMKLSGWLAFRYSAMTSLDAPEDSDDICAAMNAYNQKLPSKLPFKARTLREFAARVCRFFPVVIFNGLATEDDTEGIAGTILEIHDDELLVREMSTRFRWMPDLLKISLSDVDCCYFGSNYENFLTRIGEYR